MRSRGFALFLAGSMVLAACGGGESSPAATDAPTTSTTTTVAETTTTAAPVTSTTTTATTVAEVSDAVDAADGETAADVALDVPRFSSADPVVPLTEAQVDELGLDCDGSDEEIARCILEWQQRNMVYCAGTDLEDCTDAIRANYVLPGLYTSHDLVEEKTVDGKVYGICHDYSVIYSAAAAYYGVDCRIVNTLSKPSEGGASTVPVLTGMSQEEYERWAAELEKEGIEYDYEVLRLIAKETPGHYWAEVKLGDEWVVQDGTRAEVGGTTEADFIATGDFEVTDWSANDASEAAYGYAVRVAQGEDLRNEGYDTVGEQFQEGREVAEATGAADDYVGVTDALGQPGRSASMDDFMQGLGLMPYLPSCEATCDFLGAPAECYEDCAEENEIIGCYEDCSGDPYYLACVYLEDFTDQPLSPDTYRACCGVELNLACETTCAGDRAVAHSQCGETSPPNSAWRCTPCRQATTNHDRATIARAP